MRIIQGQQPHKHELPTVDLLFTFHEELKPCRPYYVDRKAIEVTTTPPIFYLLGCQLKAGTIIVCCIATHLSPSTMNLFNSPKAKRANTGSGAASTSQRQQTLQQPPASSLGTWPINNLSRQEGGWNGTNGKNAELIVSLFVVSSAMPYLREKDSRVVG